MDWWSDGDGLIDVVIRFELDLRQADEETFVGGNMDPAIARYEAAREHILKEGLKGMELMTTFETSNFV